MRLILLLVLGLVAAASAAYSHDRVDLPELPTPEISRIFPVADLHTAFRWAGWEPSEATLTRYADQIDSQTPSSDGVYLYS